MEDLKGVEIEAIRVDEGAIKDTELKQTVIGEGDL